MSRTASRRLLAQSPSSLFADYSSSTRLSIQHQRAFSSSPSIAAKGPNDTIKFSAALPPQSKPSPGQSASQFPHSPSLNPKAKQESGMGNLGTLFQDMVDLNQYGRSIQPRRRTFDANFASDLASDGNLLDSDTKGVEEKSWQLHIYATRHNVHLTVVRPPGWVNPQTGKRYPEKGDNRTVALSYSAGNLGFRKSGRKHYDSAFQLASYVFVRMQDSGLNGWIGELEVFLRGFGAGREAVTKALLGSEGRFLRGKVVKVSDATRLKFGGTRSRKPRRLG